MSLNELGNAVFTYVIYPLGVLYIVGVTVGSIWSLTDDVIKGRRERKERKMTEEREAARKGLRHRAAPRVIAEQPTRHVILERSGLPGTLADTESLGFVDGIRAVLRQRWITWVERNLGHSAKKRLDVRGEIAKSGGGMLNQTVHTQTAMASVMHNQIVLERAARGEGPIPGTVATPTGPSLQAGTGTPLISGLPGSEAIEPAALPRLACRALIDLGHDLEDPGVRSAWSKWEQDVVRRYRPADAQALIETARGFLEEANRPGKSAGKPVGKPAVKPVSPASETRGGALRP
jgi:hypothetical protein